MAINAPFTLITSQPAVVASLSALLQASVAHNDAKPPAPYESLTVFHALEAPAISVPDYVRRIARYAFCSDACLVAAFHYVNRAIAADPRLALTSLSVHRLLITATVLACKYFDDVSYNLLYYSKVGGLPLRELASLELAMLHTLNFRLDIPAAAFVQIERDILAQLAHGPTPQYTDELAIAALFSEARDLAVEAGFLPLSLAEPRDPVAKVATSLISVVATPNVPREKADALLEPVEDGVGSEIDYEYTAVSEPAPVAAVHVGVLGAFLTRVPSFSDISSQNSATSSPAALRKHSSLRTSTVSSSPLVPQQQDTRESMLISCAASCL